MPTGSETPHITMGIVGVARLAAAVTGPPRVMSTSGRRRIKFFDQLGARSYIAFA